LEKRQEYKVGVSENPWAKIDKDRLNNAEEFLNSRVMGQEKAVKQAATILRRAFFNLSGSQFSRYSNRPRVFYSLQDQLAWARQNLQKP